MSGTIKTLSASHAPFGTHSTIPGRKSMRRRPSKRKFLPDQPKTFQFSFLTVFKQNEPAKSFHEILAPVIVLGNIFSIFPVSGIFSKDAKNVKFRLLYPVTMFSMVIQLCFVTELVLLFIFLSKTGPKFYMVGELNGRQEVDLVSLPNSSAGQTIFTLTCIFGGLYFFYLATRWQRIITTWLEHERVFLIPPYSNKTQSKCVWWIRISAYVVMVLSVIDHYIYLASAMEKTEIQMLYCDETKRDFWRILYINERQVFYTIIPYYWWQIPFFELYEVIKTACWTYSEVFITSISITLAMRFQQLTDRIKCHEKQRLSEKFWNEIRCHYNVLCNLVLKADKVLSPFVLVYSFSNMFFLCQKIFTQFEPNRARWERYYSYYSSILLAVRFVGMLCCAASVNEKSRAALRLLRDVPNKSFAGLDVIKSSSI